MEDMFYRCFKPYFFNWILQIFIMHQVKLIGGICLLIVGK